MKFSRWVFWMAGAYGLIVLAPQYFMEQKFGADFPPAINHPEFYFGFLGVAIAWQVAFLIIGGDPARYRPLIWPAILEKFSFAIAAMTLFLQNRLPMQLLAAGLIDLAWGVLFFIAWIRLGRLSAT